MTRNPTYFIVYLSSPSFYPSQKPIMTNNGGIPSRCWCGKGIVTYVSKTEENPYRRFFRCEIGLQRKKEQHLFKWVDEALLDEIERMHEQQSIIAEEIEDLRSSLKTTVEEMVIKHKKSEDVGLIGSILTILCLCSKFD
ncbi:uncharacterized protein At4g04775-like [Brassica napus]|uniref:uncharacterized protein At4g04775-like n=1 Tax=Brassica napus TaxID=3708 RepID=UPI0006AB54C9|nr:uncharacterized protein At4g04775-like [Brassica napus]